MSCPSLKREQRGQALRLRFRLGPDAVHCAAACSAALAGCGRGKDADQTDDAERTRLREQALAWLRADLTAWSAQLKDNPEKAAATIHQKMQHWQQDADLAGMRDPDALAKLPADERQPWRQFWDDVETLRQRAAGPKGP